MTYIEFKVKAKNSSGEQTLCLSEDSDEFWLTLYGVFNGQSMQFDFDALSESDVEDLKVALELLLESHREGKS